MNLKNVLAGIDILQRYTTKEPDKFYPFAADHDVLYFNTDKPVNNKDRKTLDALGWIESDDYDTRTTFFAFV
jgi:hypothetical protein